MGHHPLTFTAPAKHQLAHHIVDMALGLVSSVTSCIKGVKRGAGEVTHLEEPLRLCVVFPTIDLFLSAARRPCAERRRTLLGSKQAITDTHHIYAVLSSPLEHTTGGPSEANIQPPRRRGTEPTPRHRAIIQCTLYGAPDVGAGDCAMTSVSRSGPHRAGLGPPLRHAQRWWWPPNCPRPTDRAGPGPPGR